MKSTHSISPEPKTKFHNPSQTSQSNLNCKTMKTKNSFRQILLAAAVALAVLLLPATSQAVDAVKANTTTMNLTTDWVGGVVPTVANALVPSWNATTITTANNLLVTLGGDISCTGMDLRPFGSSGPNDTCGNL